MCTNYSTRSKVMSSHDTPIAAVNSKKRELSSPEYSVDSKKNRATVSESDLDISDLSETSSPPPLGMASDAAMPHFVIPPSEMEKLSLMLQETFKGQIETLVQGIVKGVLKGLNDRIDGLESNINTTLQTKNEELEKENSSLITRIAALEKIADQSEQYSRRNSLRISGFKEHTGEKTDDIVVNMAATIGCDLQLNEIDRSHRVGKPDATKTRHREILVKFASYRARQKLYKMRTSLKDNGYAGVFLNEDLTRKRSNLLFEARKVVKADCAKGAWSADGNILIKDFTDKVHRLTSVDDLNAIDFPPKPPPAPEVEATVSMD